MRYYTIIYPTRKGTHIQETYSEDQIIDEYFQRWEEQMLKQNKTKEEITEENCIKDWVDIHWARETDMFGGTLD